MRYIHTSDLWQEARLKVLEGALKDIVEPDDTDLSVHVASGLLRNAYGDDGHVVGR